MAWYKTGTISVINGQTSVTGTGTKFATNARVGDGFNGPDGNWYEVTNITSETVLAIFPAYQGTTNNSSSNYMIAPLQGYNKESADRLRAITDTLTVVTSVAGKVGEVVLNKSDVGLNNVDNTSDLNKPISTLQQTAIDLKINKSDIVDNVTTNDSTKVLSAKQGKFLYDTIEVNKNDVYTKTESDNKYYTKTDSDNRYYTKTQIDASVDFGYIAGLRLVWISGTQVSIGAGSAYVPSVGKRVTYAGGVLTLATVTQVNSFLHFYLSSTGTILQTTTEPERYYNIAWRISGDNSYRYIGSVLVNTNALGCYRFQHDPQQGYMAYTHGDPQAQPFMLISNVNTSQSFNVRKSTPATATAVEGAWQNTGTSGSIRFTPSDASTPVTTGWCIFVLPGIISGRCPIAADGTITIGVTAPAAGSAYTTGYYFQR